MNNQNVIKICCPHCGAQLSVKNQPGIEGKNVTCPICKQKEPFLSYRRINIAEDPGTDLPGGYGSNNSDRTQIGDTPHPGSSQPLLGKLTVVSNGQTYTLHPGRNVIGRKAQASSANFQINTGEGRRMSREHLIIDVQRVGNIYMHTASLYKERVNDTLVNSEKIMFGDGIILKNGDIIHLPDADVKFCITDGEDTTF